MKGIKIEIQTTLLAIVIILAAAVSGFYFFRGLAGLVDVVHRQAKSDPVLIEIRNIASDLPELENTARLYILSGDAMHLLDYREMNDSIVSRIHNVDSKSGSSYFEAHLLDSVRSLVLNRLIIWSEILDIHLSANDITAKFPDVARRILTTPSDTVEVEVEVPRKGFLANLFGKRKTTVETIVKEPETIASLPEELEKLQRSIQENTERIKSREALLIEKSQEAAASLYSLIWQMETIEKDRIESNTLEADVLAASAKERVLFFGIIMVLLVSLLIFQVFRFISKNRETQKVLIGSRQEALELARAKEMFIAHVSHEMRTPVNAVYGVTRQVLQRELDQRLREDLTVVHNSAEHLLNLVNDTLDLARINSNMLSFSPADFSPASVMQEAIGLAGPGAGEKKITLVYEQGDNMPEALYGDPLRLKQMVLNLLSNAVKFTERGEVKLTAEIVKQNGEFILDVMVTDTGIGISEHDLPKVFDEFMQSGSNDPLKHRGTGLGLSIVKSLAELQGGEVRISSIPGKGSRIGFKIPYKKGNPGNLRTKEVISADIHDQLHNLRILVVDDEPYNRHLLRMIMQKWEIEMIEATNGQEAVYMALSNDFDAILMDIRMPVKDGVQASREILEGKPGSLIIASTAAAGKEETDRFLEAGMQAVLAKPFTELQLAELLGRFFAIRGAAKTDPVVRMSSGGDNHPRVNIDELYRISNGNNGFYLELIQIFINTTEKGLNKIREAFIVQDYDTISNLAHKMASPVNHLQAKLLYQKLKELENLDYALVHVDDVNELISRIEDEVRLINQYLRKVYIKEKGTDFPESVN
jgi:signal transduction histidine kinase/HPt (histidine-containing phosphotransfer) domain-containing protein/ActR/RegA family two-component response regulator